MNKMNDDLHYIPESPDPACDQMLDRYFDQVELPEVDPADLTMMTRMKILQNGLMRSRRRWKIISMGTVAASLAIVFTLVGWLILHDNHAGSGEQYAESTVQGYGYNEMTVPTGQRMTLVLPDGTKLIANSRSSVRYPTRFVGDTRTVWASGEVYFEVTKDASKPFIVNADGFNVKVYGTTFSISNYDPANASVVLVEGSVAVSTDSYERVKMRPGHQVSIRDGAIDEMKSVDTSVFTSWIRGCIMLDNQTLGNIIPRLSKYYNVNIEVDSNLNNSKLYGSLDLKGDIEGVLSVLSSIIPMSIEELPDGNTFRLSTAN